MQNEVIRQASKWDNFVAERSRFLKQKSNKKNGWTRLILNFSYSKLKSLQNMLSYFLKSKQNTQNMNPKALKTSNCYHQNVLYVAVKIKIYEIRRS